MIDHGRPRPRTPEPGEDLTDWPSWCTKVVIATSNYPGRGGVQTTVANLVQAFRSQGVSVQVISIFPGLGAPTTEATAVFSRRPQIQMQSITGRKRIGLHLIRALPTLAIKRWDLLIGNFRMRQIMAPLRGDGLIIATSPSVARHLPRRRTRRSHKRPIFVVQYHVPFETQELLEGSSLPTSRAIHPDAFVALSYDDARRFSGALRAQCFRLPNPIELQRRVDLSIDATDKGDPPHRVVSLSRLSGEKQLDRMVTNFLDATDTDELRHWVLDIYGEGDQRDVILDAIRRNHGEERVHLMGWTENRHEVLTKASLLLSTSRFEGFGMNVLEAAQSGTATLAFACSPGLVDLVHDLGGVLVDAGDDGAFIAQLRRLLSSPEELTRLGDAARRDCERYSSTAVMLMWGQLLQKIRQRDTKASPQRPAAKQDTRLS